MYRFVLALVVCICSTVHSEEIKSIGAIALELVRREDPEGLKRIEKKIEFDYESFLFGKENPADLNSWFGDKLYDMGADAKTDEQFRTILYWVAVSQVYREKGVDGFQFDYEFYKKITIQQRRQLQAAADTRPFVWDEALSKVKVILNFK